MLIPTSLKNIFSKYEIIIICIPTETEVKFVKNKSLPSWWTTLILFNSIHGLHDSIVGAFEYKSEKDKARQGRERKKGLSLPYREEASKVEVIYGYFLGLET